MKEIYEFRILHDGWEMDNRGWIAEDDKGKKFLMTTNHGRTVPLKVQEIHDKIHETRKSLAGLKEALKIISKH